MESLKDINEVILVINAGSSSIKFKLFQFESLKLMFFGEIEGISDSARLLIYNEKHKCIVKQELRKSDYEFSMNTLFNWIEAHPDKYSLKSVGHRIVHGGGVFHNPVLINADVINKLKIFIPLAPLHEPHNIEAIEAIFKVYPKVIQVGCFDTSFHHTQNRLAMLFAIPRKLSDEGILRYGFHGLSYEYIASILPEKLDTTKNKKIIVAHLGHGSSMCALFQRKSIATSMGFTALDGLMMGTRCGTIDPGVILYLFEEKKLSLQKINHILYHESGLMGVSGISDDMRDLLASDRPEAQDAIDLYCYRAARELSSLVTVLKGCDAIVFTAGIGENASPVRKKICHWLEWLGIKLDNKSNNENKDIISTNDSKVLVAVIPTNEEVMIAKHTKAVISMKNIRF